jgi:carbamate kinase
VVDKDLASAVSPMTLAPISCCFSRRSQGALSFQQPDQIDLDSLSLSEAAAISRQVSSTGTMGPKVQAAMECEASGRRAIITTPDALEHDQGRDGTHIVGKGSSERGETKEAALRCDNGCGWPRPNFNMVFRDDSSSR